MKTSNTSKITVYIHKTSRMSKNNKKKFLKSERPRIEVKLQNKQEYFMYADEFAQFIINSFEYGEGD